MIIATSLTTVLIIGLLCTWIAPVSAQGSWTALADTPGDVDGGGALVFAGGYLIPANKLAVLAPYLILACVLGAATFVFIKRKHK